VHEAQARILARDLALVLQAALLHRQAPGPVFEAFCLSRLAATPDVFGLLPAGIDCEALVLRALPAQTA
jgi:putative acyl-CoA dehydrogenase